MIETGLIQAGMARYGVTFQEGFFCLNVLQKDELLAWAKVSGYRKRQGTHGSLARCFYSAVSRKIAKEVGYTPKGRTPRPRTTIDIWVVQSNYGSGFEDARTVSTQKEGLVSLKEYQQNDPVGWHRVVFRRVKKSETVL